MPFAFTTIATVNLIYQNEVAGLNPLQLVLVGTTLELTAFLFEIPTGVVADVYSRRLSVIIGVFLMGAGFLIEGTFPVFTAILLAQVVWGIGYTFISGAREAWIADEIGPAPIGPVFLRASQVAQMAALLAIPVSVALGSVRLNLPVLAGGGMMIVLAALLIAVMPEHGFTPKPPEERGSWRAMANQFRDGACAVRGRPVLITLLVIAAFIGMASEGFDRLWQAHLLDDFRFPTLGGFKPVVWFGVISAVSSLLSIGGAELVKRRVDTTDQARVSRLLTALGAVQIAGALGFALVANFYLALVLLWIGALARRLNAPLFTTWLNQHVESGVRATVFSMRGQMDSLGQVVGGPMIGVIGTVVSIRAAIAVAAVTLSPALWLYTRATRQGEAAAAPTPDPSPAARERGA